MLYNKRLIVIVSFFFILACTEELKTTFIDVNLTTDTNKLVEINIPRALENNLVSTEINSEINKLVISELQIGETDSITSNSIEESISLFNKEYTDFNIDFPGITAPWEAQIDGEVLFQSNDVISIAITSYVNKGGAHGTTNISFINFDAVNGKRIPNAKLIKNKAAFISVAKSFFEAALKEEDITFDSDSFKLPANMAYNNDGFILLYNTYEIAPYSTGIIDFTIPFEKVSSFLVFDGSK